MDATISIRDRIIDAAWDRFYHYGFGKTSMAEIAKDCDMSAANIYRFFKNKSEIGSEVALRSFKKNEAFLRKVLQRDGLSAAKRLELFAVESLGYLVKEFSESPELAELVNFIANERWDVVTRRMDMFRSLIAEILAEGNRTGEFDIPDVAAAANDVRLALAMFHAPPILMIAIKRYPLEEYKDMARNVVSLLVNGLVGK